MSNLKTLMETVVKNDYCIGCGICAGLENSPLEMVLNEKGKFSPVIKNDYNLKDKDIDFLSICPFSENNNIENEIAKEQFGDEEKVNFNEYTGYFLNNYAGHVVEGDYRSKGSSGGMGSWIAVQLLENNLIDGIIHVKEASNNEELLFEYQVSQSVKEFVKGAKSKYYPIELSKVISFLRENEGRYAVIGIPCYIKGLRLLAKKDKVVDSRLKFYIGLVCGHLKSDFFAKSMGWQLGIDPENLKGIDFRKKIDERSADDYGVEVSGIKDGKEVKIISPKNDLYTTHWGHGFFKYNACEFCDDVLAETADVTVGDAWIPEFSKDSQGTNLIIVRNPIINSILKKAQDEKIFLKELSESEVYDSQAGGFRHRREGLSYRLYLKDIKNEWRPQKRVKPNGEIPNSRKLVYENRSSLSSKSFDAFISAKKSSDFEEFIKYMAPHLKKYNKINSKPLHIKVIKKLRKEFLRLNYISKRVINNNESRD